MDAPKPPRLNPKKLLPGKSTAVVPRDKEKHFIATQRVLPATASVPPQPVVDVVVEAVHSGRSRSIAWRELTDTARWRQGRRRAHRSPNRRPRP